jgi:hypothetical protein
LEKNSIKIPEGAKKIGNYVLGILFLNKENQLDQVHLEKFIWECI